MTIKKAGEVKPEIVERAAKTEIEWLIDRRDGAPNFELRKFRIRPHGSIPKHLHPDIEHEQYVLSGSYVMGIGESVQRVKVGDSIYVPAGTVHWYQNDGPEDAEFLCIIPKKEKYEAIYLEEASTGSKS